MTLRDHHAAHVRTIDIYWKLPSCDGATRAAQHLGLSVGSTSASAVDPVNSTLTRCYFDPMDLDAEWLFGALARAPNVLNFQETTPPPTSPTAEVEQVIQLHVDEIDALRAQIDTLLAEIEEGKNDSGETW